MANNLRDIRGDTQVGKRTLATRLGDARTRSLYLILLSLSALLIIIVALLTSWWALLGLAGFVLIIPAVRIVLSGGSGPALIAVLKATSLAELAERYRRSPSALTPCQRSGSFEQFELGFVGCQVPAALSDPGIVVIGMRVAAAVIT
mgnify:CR=1 FL=1